MMLKEIPNQRIAGRPMGEQECFQGAIEHLLLARDCLRGLALLRMDTRWLIPVQHLDRIVDNLKRLIEKGGARVTIMRERTRP